MILKNNKGAMFYTLIGIMVLVMVSVVVLHIMRTTYSPGTADNIQTRKFTNALNNLQATMQPIARYSQYPALWKVGHNVTEEGVNVYLALGENNYDKGRDKLEEDLEAEFKENFYSYLQSLSETNNTERYTIRSDGIPFIVERATGGKVNVTESPRGMKFSIPLHIESQYGDMRYENNVVIVSETPTRIFDMYERSYKFHQEYETNVQWATTIALYMRAYVNGYNPAYNGSYLKEGHVAYDPIDTLLRGDIAAFKNMSLDSITGVGSVPMATWLTEWSTLGEPSFLPPSTDFDLSLHGSDLIVNMMKDGYDIDKAANCSALEGENRTECESFNNADELKDKAESLKTQKSKLKSIVDKIDLWEKDAKSEMSCDAFRTMTEPVVNNILDDFNAGRTNQRIVYPAEGWSTGTQMHEEIKENEQVVSTLKSAVDNLSDMITPPSGRVAVLSVDLCLLAAPRDCERVYSDDCDKDSESCSFGSCTECENPDYLPLKCSAPKEADYSCSSFDNGDSPREQDVSCKEVTCTEECTEGDDGEEDCSIDYSSEPTDDDTMYIDQCNCQCHPTDKFIKVVKGQLDVVSSNINSQMASIDEQIKALEERAKMLDEADAKLEQINKAIAESESLDYDVSSQMDFSEVKYWDGLSPSKCYVDPTWQASTNGTCGDGVQSTGLYGTQITAAIVCCGFIEPCCFTVDYSTKWFPAIYQIEGKYSISESLIDDRNRIMPHNIFAGEGDLYGLNETPKLFQHVAPEFVIYKEYHIKVTPATLDRVIVYLYLPRVASEASTTKPLDKVINSFTDPTCGGVKC